MSPRAWILFLCLSSTVVSVAWAVTPPTSPASGASQTEQLLCRVPGPTSPTAMAPVR